MSEESIKPPSTTDNSFNPKIIYKYGKARTKFNGICLRQDNILFIHGNVVNLYFLGIRYIAKRFKHRFHIRLLLIWSCEVN